MFVIWYYTHTISEGIHWTDVCDPSVMLLCCCCDYIIQSWKPGHFPALGHWDQTIFKLWVSHISEWIIRHSYVHCFATPAFWFWLVMNVGCWIILISPSLCVISAYRPHICAMPQRMLDLQWWESGLFSPWQNICLCNWQEVGKASLTNARHHICYSVCSRPRCFFYSQNGGGRDSFPLAGYSVSPLPHPHSPHCFISNHWLAIFTTGQCWALSGRTASPAKWRILSRPPPQASSVMFFHGWCPIHCICML